MQDKEFYTFQITYFLNIKDIVHSKKITIEADYESEAIEILRDQYNIISIKKI